MGSEMCIRDRRTQVDKNKSQAIINIKNSEDIKTLLRLENKKKKKKDLWVYLTENREDALLLSELRILS